jgi:hypothetical protein
LIATTIVDALILIRYKFAKANFPGIAVTVWNYSRFAASLRFLLASGTFIDLTSKYNAFSKNLLTVFQWALPCKPPEKFVKICYTLKAGFIAHLCYTEIFLL